MKIKAKLFYTLDGEDQIQETNVEVSHLEKEEEELDVREEAIHSALFYLDLMKLDKELYHMCISGQIDLKELEYYVDENEEVEIVGDEELTRYLMEYFD